MAARLLEHGMVGMQRGPDCQSFVSSGWLNIGPTERRDIEKLAIGYAVERASASHRQIFARDTAVKLIQQMEEDLFEPLLQREGKVHVALRNLAVRTAGFAE